MILVGLTGGIGSGKSTVSALLVERGAVLIDADAVVREVQQPGSPVLAEIAERFGPQVIDEHGSLDRQAVADIVFADPDALKALNAIVHPAVGREMVQRVNAQVDTDNVVVLDIPLLAERPRKGLQATIVVDVPVEVQVERLVTYRGFSEADARARIANQASREQRLGLGVLAAQMAIANENGADVTRSDRGACVHERVLPERGPRSSPLAS
ncbi:MAG TPA: dephospho-CoA kinase, partial [Ilumatobacteraceae bacterium]|nr:dephospho-CoA kinase [Ilumatobacteraceae bacterium]